MLYGESIVFFDVIHGQNEGTILWISSWFFPIFSYTFPMQSFLLTDYEIGHYSGYKTRVYADYFFEITTENDLQKLHEAYIFSQEKKLPFLIIWWGTNILFSKSRFEWIVIKNSIVGWEYNEEKKILHANASSSIWEISETLEIEYNQPIWHRFIWLPGSIWGAVFWNAGCFGLETESNFSRATVFNMQTWVRQNRPKEDMGFSYRHSYLKDNPDLFLIDVWFDLSEKIEKYASEIDVIDFRENKQPKGNCCGSFFKNPSREISAGMLIESVWLKWYHLGWAHWSPIHANFLMSDGESCLPWDLIEIIRFTQDIVKKEKGIDLINEVRII